MIIEQAYNLENELWLAAKNRDSKRFLELVEEDAILICGGFRCFGYEYAKIVEEFDCSYYKIDNFELVSNTNDSYQVHYIFTMDVADEMNKDLAGIFHITTTWNYRNSSWKVVFNMDHKIEQI